MARKLTEINAGSMADIAFLLLIFFLMTTTMDVDTGILRKLPPPLPPDQEEPPPIRERNVFIVLINRNNQLLVEGELLDISQLREKTKEFITNPKMKENLSEQETLAEKKEEAVEKQNAKEATYLTTLIKVFGPQQTISKGVVSLQNDRGTGYETYIAVQNELVAAYNELKEELSKNTFNVSYEELDEDREKMIRTIYPLSISEAEPKNIK